MMMVKRLVVEVEVDSVFVLQNMKINQHDCSKEKKITFRISFFFLSLFLNSGSQKEVNYLANEYFESEFKSNILIYDKLS